MSGEYRIERDQEGNYQTRWWKARAEDLELRLRAACEPCAECGHIDYRELADILERPEGDMRAERMTQKHVTTGNRLEFNYTPTPPSGPHPEPSALLEERDNLLRDRDELLLRFQALRAIAGDLTISHHRLGKALRETPGILGPS